MTLTGLTVSEAGAAPARAVAGFLALARDDAAAARIEFEAAAIGDTQAVASYGMGLVAERLEQPDTARQWYEAAIEQDPGLARADLALRALDLRAAAPRLAQAEEALATGDVDGAVAAYQRAIELAPDVEGAYLSLARLQVGRGNRTDAITTLERARDRLGDSPRILEPMADLYRADERIEEAAEVYGRLRDLRPGDRRIAELARETRERYEAAALPPEYREVASKEVIVREDLAALLAINLEQLESRVSARSGIIVADGGSRWASPYIQRAVEWGILDVYQNNFIPDMQVRRSMLVEACYRVLELIGAADDGPRPTLDDPPPEHLLYEPVQAVVGYGLMETDSENSIDLLEPVSGAEAIGTIQRLSALIRERSR